MIVCFCNVLSDDDICVVVVEVDDVVCYVKQVYGCFGCSVECGWCVCMIKIIIDEVLGFCVQFCCVGCLYIYMVVVNDEVNEFV